HLIYSDQVLSIIAKTPAEVDILRNMSTQHETVLWQPASARHIKPDTEVHLYIPKHHVQNVTDLLKTHLVLLQDTQELIAMQTRNHTSDPRSSETFYERYHSLEDIYYWINRTITDNPDRAKVILIGSSYEKRPLYVLKLSGRKSNDAKKAMWIDCGIHAREWISPAFCLWFCLKYYGENVEVTQLLDTLDLYVLPVMNPDGYKYTWTTNRMWRKNRSKHPHSDCIGTDLNRNFDANWCTEGASDYPCEEIYCGQFPESEPESRAVANFLRSHKDTVKLYFSIHSYSQMLLFPYSCSYEQAQNHDELLALVQEAAQNIRRYYRNQYKYGAGAKTIYLAPGGSDDWAYKMGIEYSFTFELQDRGTYGFLLPPSYITKASKEAALAVKGITLRVIQKKQWASPPQS
uniref:Peptidase M14 domain-containing protein n=1 Tax=Denticeps clupeoides TaxID=299321 RepID=A0AAY4EGX1_9TELE